MNQPLKASRTSLRDGAAANPRSLGGKRAVGVCELRHRVEILTNKDCYGC